MAVTTLSSQMQSIISTVLSNTVSGLYTIGCTFFNTNTKERSLLLTNVCSCHII